MATVLLGACKKEDMGSQELMVYMTGEYGAYNNEIVIPFVHTPVGVSGNNRVKLAVSATREVPVDISITVAADTSLVAAFNREHGTAALPLPANTYQIVNPGKYRMRAGDLVSDSVEVEITNPALLTHAEGYLLPLSISGVEGEDKGIRVSTNRHTTYLLITYAFNNIADTEEPLAGTLADRTGWSVTVSNTSSGGVGPNMLDGNSNTSWRSSNSSSAAKWVVMDMGGMQEMKAILISPNYVSRNENATGITVSVSQDGENWTVQGDWKGTGPDAASSAADPDLKGINFIAPVQARYFRLDITSRVAGNRVGIGELNVIQ